ncbi:hypothetical protein FD13_GL000618 [Levilactobacillus senmaizukei DSM 21775 = NBRC 103853]|uniref:Uncharacterized protein n=1 Tax=Levilactobacillus senmaizukei DSM 21775 = NBRC 103853 TaxID=1423803 RepID=A0A0R2DPD0_9LACO|nr:hypothetical protein [Levilactobacillus senmaizukei]KRN01789.1 hypothetical protein FD13_GL000618 [Levilactobacillus senmaizukei DSM 21775 = NBRC 103853]
MENIFYYAGIACLIITGLAQLFVAFQHRNWQVQPMWAIWGWLVGIGLLSIATFLAI